MKQRARSIIIFPWRVFRWATRRAIYQLIASDPRFREKIRALAPQGKASIGPTDNKPSLVNPLTLKAQIIEAVQRMPAPPLGQPISSSKLNFSQSSDLPMVTVAVPLFNEPKFIFDTIESLKRQTFTNFEAIIVDDCSTDESRAFLWTAPGASIAVNP